MSRHDGSPVAWFGVFFGLVAVAACGGDDAAVVPAKIASGGAPGAGAGGAAGKSGAAIAGAAGLSNGGMSGTTAAAGEAGASGVGGAPGGSAGAAGVGGAPGGSGGAAGTMSSGGNAGTSGGAGALGGSAGTGGAAVGGMTSAGSGGAIGGGAGEAGAGGGPAACAQQTAEAKLVKRPLDLIVYLDTSDSMKPAITQTEANLETKLTATLAASGIDYRAIMIVGKKVPAAPADASRFSYVLAAGGSIALHDNLIAWYDAPPSAGGNAQPGWSTYLRKDAFKVILVISDTTGGPTLDAASFDAQLLAKSPELFGTKDKRNYRYHAIMGVAQNVPPTAPWLPSDPLVPGACTGYPGAVAPNVNAQEEAILTGGLRFPLCETASFDQVFQAIAVGEIEKAPVQCAFPIPTPPPPTIIDETTIEIRATGGGLTETYSRVADVASCKEGRFTIANGQVTLCPAACAAVQALVDAKVDVAYGCKLPPKDLISKLDDDGRGPTRHLLAHR